MHKKKLTESDVTAESVFMLRRRQILKTLGISAAALSLSPTARADLLDWFKGMIGLKPSPANHSSSVNRLSGKTR